MFYKVQVTDHIRVPPDLFNLDVKDAIAKEIKKQYSGYISKDMGVVIDVSSIDDVNEGMILPEDGAAYYETKFSLITFEPELQEVIAGKIKDIADFGAFIGIGPIEGMIHISQTMNDFVSFGKDKVLLGKDSHRSLVVGDNCYARIIAISYKDLDNPKLGLTMRQPGLGKIEWVHEDLNGEAKAAPAVKKKKEKEQ